MAKLFLASCSLTACSTKNIFRKHKTNSKQPNTFKSSITTTTTKIMRQQMREALREKAELFYASKVRAGGFIRVSMQTLRARSQLLKMNFLQRLKAHTRTMCSPWLLLTLKVPVHHKPTFGRHEEIARRPVPTFSGPTENDFLAARKAVFGLTTIGASTKKERKKLFSAQERWKERQQAAT